MTKKLQEQLEIAKQIAYEAHKGQKRNIGRREDYIEHPKRVAGKFSKIESQIVAWLHDVLEDSDLHSKDLVERGIDIELVRKIVLLTKEKDEHYLSYILRCKSDLQTKSIKIADIEDNLEKLNYGSLRDKYLLALYILRINMESNNPQPQLKQKRGGELKSGNGSAHPEHGFPVDKSESYKKKKKKTRRSPTKRWRI